MTMHEHDFEAIAALVTEGGTLDPAASACDECRTEYATQERIRSMLAEAPPPQMSGAELAILRSGVNAELGSPYNRRLRRLVAASSVAAGFLVLVGVGPMLLGQPGADMAALDTTSATEAGSVAEDAARTSIAESAAPAAAGAEMAVEDRFAEIRDGGMVTEEELTMLEDEMREALETSSLKLGPAEYLDRERVVPPCLPESTVLGSIEAELAGREVVSYLVADGEGRRTIERYDAESCELLARR